MERRGKKSVAQTPAPKKDRIYGSERNPKGSASSSKSASKIELSESIINTLENKRDEYNAKHPNGKVTLATLKAVFRRGAGAYSSSHRPTITGGRPNSRSAWAFARVNKFLLKKGGTKVKAAYVQDDDLMERGGITDSLGMAMGNLKKNGIVLKDKNETITLIAYNTGNQERKPSLYNKSLIYKSVQPIKSANEIIQNFDFQDFEMFSEDKMEEYKKSHLILLNQNEVVYDSKNADIRFDDGGKVLSSVRKFYDWFINWYKDGKIYEKMNISISIPNEFTKIDAKADSVILDLFEKIDQNIDAKKYMEQIISKADNFGVSIYLEAIPRYKYINSEFKKEKISSTYLIDYYKQFGFQIIGKALMKRTPKSKLEYGGNLGQEITCVNCGWHWNTNQSDEFDKYVCHKCGFDNRTFYDSDPIGKFKNGGNIENEFDELDNDQLVKTLKSFYSDLSESPIFEYLDLKVGDYTLNIGDNEFVIFKKKPFSKIESIKIGRFIQPYFDASKKPLFARFFDSYTVSGNNIIIKLKDMYAKGGGLKKPHTILEIAQKHNVKVSEIVKALNKGQKVESEHTKDIEIAKTIAKHHLWESPNYYDKLKEMEKTFEEGGKVNLDEIALPDSYANIDSLNRILQNQGYEIVKSVKNKDIFETGGMVVGKSHQEADENGTGEKFKLKSTGQIVELEGGEAVIVGSAIDSNDKINFNGEEMTPREIASYLNHAYGGVKFEKGGQITCGCSHKKYYHGGELPSAVVNSLQGGEAVITKKTMESQDKYEYEGEKLTPRQILSRINHKYGGVSFAKGGKLTRFSKDPVNIASKMIYFVNNMIYG